MKASLTYKINKNLLQTGQLTNAQCTQQLHDMHGRIRRQIGNREREGERDAE